MQPPDVYRTRVEIATTLAALGASMWLIGGASWLTNGLLVDPAVAAVGRMMFLLSLFPWVVSVVQRIRHRA